MTNIICAKAGGLSGCTHIYVIVLQNTFLMGGDIACFPLSMYYYNFFTTISTTFLSFQGKILVDIIVKYLDLRLSSVILRPVTNNIELLDKFR